MFGWMEQVVFVLAGFAFKALLFGFALGQRITGYFLIAVMGAVLVATSVILTMLWLTGSVQAEIRLMAASIALPSATVALVGAFAMLIVHGIGRVIESLERELYGESRNY